MTELGDIPLLVFFLVLILEPLGVVCELGKIVCVNV